jgi:desulfoferrodoxin-like iron-binding protein
MSELNQVLMVSHIFQRLDKFRCEIKPGRMKMAVQAVNESYKCNICGNEVIVTTVGGGTLVCCGEEVELLETIAPTVNIADID